MNIYDRNGKPMSREEFEAVPFKKRVLKAQTLMLKGEPIRILTMWDGVDMAHGEASVPCPFSTAVFSESYPNMLTAVPDERRARVSHEMMVGFVRAQGGKGGWRLLAYYAGAAWREPKSLRAARVNTVIAALVLAIQLATLTAGFVVGRLNWMHLLNVVMAAVFVWTLWCSIQGWRNQLRIRKERKRSEKERKEFENIVGPLR